MLESTLLRKATGAKVTSGDRVFVRYEGKLLDGSSFDANFSFSDFQAVPGRDLFSFVLGQNQVIQGWEIGLKGAKLGQVLKLVIPPELAYGSTARPGIPANSTLEFTVEVVGFSKGDQQPAVAYDLADVGIKLEKYGLSDADIKRVAVGKIGTNLNENLVGSDGIDFLTGLAGSNVIKGGLAQDLLVSTNGADIFKYDAVIDSPAGKKSRDIVAGFTRNDRIDLTAIGASTELQFIGSNKFSGTAGEISFSNGLLQLDVNGDRRAEFEIGFAGKTQLNGSSFIS